ncbi:hypothetical protein [Moorena producens]|uniref:hypothetical protein n=1 Tax=Moorena producens TaxID=1155739 RepID=UPI0011EA69C1|nr:hypothetical protein [Moorena producens]
MRSLFPVPCSRLDAVAHGGNHGNSEWLEVTVRQLSLVLMQSLMGETPKTAQITLINKFYPFCA